MHAAARSYANACLVPCRGRCSPPDFAMRWMLPGLASHSRPAHRFLPEARARAAQRRSPVSAADPARAASPAMPRAPSRPRRLATAFGPRELALRD
eukprot:scaffold17801_cov63-Phaeocystis_antarctica.AAC.5